jgi:hypothetical protein
LLAEFPPLPPPREETEQEREGEISIDLQDCLVTVPWRGREGRRWDATDIAAEINPREGGSASSRRNVVHKALRTNGKKRERGVISLSHVVLPHYHYSVSKRLKNSCWTRFDSREVSVVVVVHQVLYR